MPMRAVVKLRTKLINQKLLTRIEDALGENCCPEETGRADVELRGPSGRVAIWDNRLIMVVVGSGWRVL